MSEAYLDNLSIVINEVVGYSLQPAFLFAMTDLPFDVGLIVSEHMGHLRKFNVVRRSLSLVEEARIFRLREELLDGRLHLGLAYAGAVVHLPLEVAVQDREQLGALERFEVVLLVDVIVIEEPQGSLPLGFVVLVDVLLLALKAGDLEQGTGLSLPLRLELRLIDVTRRLARILQQLVPIPPVEGVRGHATLRVYHALPRLVVGYHVDALQIAVVSEQLEQRVLINDTLVDLLLVILHRGSPELLAAFFVQLTADEVAGHLYRVTV